MFLYFVCNRPFLCPCHRNGGCSIVIVLPSPYCAGSTAGISYPHSCIAIGIIFMYCIPFYINCHCASLHASREWLVVVAASHGSSTSFLFEIKPPWSRRLSLPVCFKQIVQQMEEALNHRITISVDRVSILSVSI